MCAEPGSDTLLPDLLPFQKQARMRTLVLDLDGVLVQSVWQRKHGWKTVKRPGVGPFLEEMAKCALATARHRFSCSSGRLAWL